METINEQFLRLENAVKNDKILKAKEKEIKKLLSQKYGINANCGYDIDLYVPNEEDY